MAVERRGPAVCSDSNKKEGKGEMIKTPISVQDLRRSLYVKAKAEVTWRFWGLYVHVCKMETLQEAYRMAKNNDGAPGVDGVTFEAIEESGRESFLKQIQDELVHDTYQPMRVRKKEIPKDGGSKIRVLSIPSIRDRVVQGALKLILEPIFEADFQSGSYGYLHYVLDLWFERVVKPRLRGEAYMVRYLDDFVLCFQYRADALRVQKALCQRLGKFGLTLESSKTKLVEFGRFAQRHASKRGRKRPETIYFLGFTLYCTRNRKGKFRVGLRTEKSRLRRALMRLQDQMRRMRHLSIREQTECLNQMLRGHYAYYGIAGNIRALQRVHRAVERYWRKMLSSRSWQGEVWWKQFQQIKERFPLLRLKLYLPYSELQAIAAL